MDVSFSGAGFMGCYYFGVVNCWNKYIPRERVRRVAGASAGSLIAAYYLMDLPLEKCLKGIIEMTEDIRKRPLGVFDRSNQMVDILPRLLDRLFPDDAHKRVNGRLFVGMTRLKDMKSVVVSEFASKQELIDALNCSCFIPVWSGNHVSTYKGVKYIDGGFTNNMPAFDEHTICVSPFAGPSDIAPYDRAHHELLRGSLQGMPFYLTWKNMARFKRALWPPPAGYIVELLECGFHDTKRFVLANDLIQCDRCFGQLEQAHEPIYTRIMNPSISPALSRACSHMSLADLQRASSFRRFGDSEQCRRSAHRLSPDTADDSASTSSGADSLGSSASSSSGVFTNEESGARCCETSDKPDAKRSLGAALRARLGALARKARRKRTDKPNLARSASIAGASCEAPTIVVQDADELAAPSELIDMGLADAQSVGSSGHSSPVASARTKLRRGGARPRRESLPLNGVSPLDHFVRRMSAAPEALELVRTKHDESCDSSGRGSMLGAGSLLAGAKFAMAPSPLPSCPPSPNLNRHCDECIHMRQQARVDLIDEAIIKQAELYRNLNATHDPEREFADLAAGGGLGARLGAWLRFFAGRSTSRAYTFDDVDDAFEALDRPSEIPSAL